MANNCLFDAVRDAYENVFKTQITGIGSSSQKFRIEIESEMKKDGFTPFPKGTEAGEHYITFISKYIDAPIIVYKDGKIAHTVKHSDVDDENEGIRINHIGDEMRGHWTVKM